MEENVLSGGFGSNVLSLLQEQEITDIKVKNIGLPDQFIEHGSPEQLRRKYGLDSEGIYKQIMALFPERRSGSEEKTPGKAGASSTR